MGVTKINDSSSYKGNECVLGAKACKWQRGVNGRQSMNQ